MLTLIFAAEQINPRLTLGGQNGLMSARHRWLNSIFAALGVSSARFVRAETLASRGAHAAAFPLFVQAARGGLRQAQYRLGRSYLLGLGVPPSIGEALRWLRRAAEAGETAAQTQLAALALQGVSENGGSGLFHDAGGDADTRCVDYQGAEHWCRQAVASGSAEAKTLLGFILTAGPEDHRDPVAGEALYSEAAQAGCSRGQLGLATTLLRDGTEASASEAVALLQSAAADGVAVAHHLLGMLAESGAAGVVDFVAAAASYKAAAELGHPQAQVRYGFALLLGRGVEHNIFDAETWLRRAALTGDSQAAAVVGYLYARDGDLPPNYAEASVWLRRAAEAGHAGAARMLGRLLLLGGDIAKDIPEAANWLRVAGESGDEAARADLVRLVLMRQVGEDDGVVVAGWLREGATAGDPAAQFQLGLCLAQGIGVERNDQAAFTWVRRAAGLGHPEAIRMLGELAGRV
jgi:hypothetical protein